LAWGFVGPDGGVCESRTVRVALYRPGYELVVVDSWDLFPKMTWKRGDQVDALVQLFPVASLELEAAAPRHPRAPLLGAPYLAPGSVSPEHRQALLFGAAEDERLAAICRGRKGAPDWQALLDCAAQLRQLAEE
jgi:hypothetical protein